jgi:hypothetical protein
MNNFCAVATIAKTLNKMPVDYRSITGKHYPTYYTTIELLSKLVDRLDNDDSLDKDIRDLKSEKSCLIELGFSKMCVFFNKYSGEAIAILGI